MSVHDWSEQSKRLFDVGALALAGLSGITVMSALNMVAVVLSCIAALVSISWGACRWHDRLKYGPPKGE